MDGAHGVAVGAQGDAAVVAAPHSAVVLIKHVVQRPKDVRVTQHQFGAVLHVHDDGREQAEAAGRREQQDKRSTNTFQLP